MKSANALLCLPAGDGTLPAGLVVSAILIGGLSPPAPGYSYHSKVRTHECASGRSELLSWIGHMLYAHGLVLHRSGEPLSRDSCLFILFVQLELDALIHSRCCVTPAYLYPHLGVHEHVFANGEVLYSGRAVGCRRSP